MRTLKSDWQCLQETCEPRQAAENTDEGQTKTQQT